MRWRQKNRFAVIGDYGYAGEAESAVSEMVKSWNPDLMDENCYVANYGARHNSATDKQKTPANRYVDYNE